MPELSRATVPPTSSLGASAEASGVETIASFDRAIDRVTTVRRVEPS